MVIFFFFLSHLCMLFGYFLILALQIKSDNEYQSLIDKARTNAKTHRKMKSSETVENSYEPGIYNFQNGSIHFRLLKKLTGPVSIDIDGYAVQNGEIAIIHSRKSTFSFDENTVFIQPSDIDSKEKKLLLLSKSIYNDNDADVYNFQEVDLFSVFTDISFVSEFHSIQKKESDYTITYDKTINGNWNEDDNLPELNDVYGAQFGLGAYISADILAYVSIPSIYNPSIDLSISFTGDAGALLEIQHISIESLTLFEKPIELAGAQVTILGLDISIGLFFDINAYLKDITIDLPYELRFYKGYSIKFSQDITVTIDGIKQSPSTIDVQTYSDMPTFDSIKDAINQISFTFTPNIDLGFRASLKFDSLFSTYLKFGIDINFPFSYKLDKSACVFPYLYGKISTIIKGYVEFGGLTLFSKDLIDAQRFSMDFFNNEASIRDTCLYNPDKTNEGDESLIVEKSPQKIVFTLESIDNEEGFDSIFGQVRIVSQSNESHVIGMITTKWLNTEETSIGFYQSSITTETINDLSVKCSAIYYNWLQDITEYSAISSVGQSSKNSYEATIDPIYSLKGHTTFKGSVIKTFAHELGKLCSISNEYISGDYYALITIPDSREYVLFEYDTQNQEYVGNAENVEYYDSTDLYSPHYNSYSINDIKISLKLSYIDLKVGSDSFMANFTAGDQASSIILTKEWPSKYYSPEDIGYKDWEFIFSINSQNENSRLDTIVTMKKASGGVDYLKYASKNHTFKEIQELCSEVGKVYQYKVSVYYKKWFSTEHFCDVVFSLERISNQVLAKIPEGQFMSKQYILMPKYQLEYNPESSFSNDPIVKYLDETYFEIEPTNIRESQKQSYSLIYSPDADPLQQHYVVDIGWYLIPITNNDAKVGFRITGHRDGKFRMGYYGQVVGYENMDTSKTIHYSSNKQISMAGEDGIGSCIFVNKSLLDSYDICYSDQSLMINTVEMKKYSFTDCSYGIIYVYSNYEITLNVYQRIYEISEEESYIVPDLYSICETYDYDSSINNNIIIQCNRASSIIYTLTDGTQEKVSSSLSSSDFRIPFDIAKTVTRIEPICENPESKNCIIQKELDPNNAYIVKYTSREGVKEESNILGGGFYSEIIHDTANLQFTKSWNGEVIFEPLYKVDSSTIKSILSDATIQYIRIIEGDNCTIKFKYNDIDIPISRVMLENDPDYLMKSIGVKEYNIRDVNINEYGQISCPLSYLTEVNTENFYTAINLPKSFSSNINIDDDFVVESSSSEDIHTTTESSSSEYTTISTEETKSSSSEYTTISTEETESSSSEYTTFSTEETKSSSSEYTTFSTEETKSSSSEYTTISTEEPKSSSLDQPSSTSHTSQISNDEGSFQEGGITTKSNVNSTVIIIIAVTVIVVIVAAVIIGFIIYKKKRENEKEYTTEIGVTLV